MNMRFALLCLAASAAVLAGCRNDPSVRELERELGWLEDQLWQLEAEYGTKVGELDSCRRENSALKGRLGMKSDDFPGGGASRSPGGPPGVPDLSVPEVDLGTPADDNEPAIPAPDVSRPYEEEVPDLDFTPAGPPIDEASGSMDNTNVDRIVLNRQLTGGHDADGQPGDEGVLVVIEPRDAENRYVPAPASVSVVLLDPARSGREAHVARWDFDVAEATSATRTSLLGRGIHLQMPWPNQPPANSQLHLFVRYTTSDGRKLEADRLIDVDPPREVSARWTPATGPGGAAGVAREPAIGSGAATNEPRAALLPDAVRPSPADPRHEDPDTAAIETPEPSAAGPHIVPPGPRSYRSPTHSTGDDQTDTWRPTR